MFQILPLPEASGPTDSKALESSTPKRSHRSSAPAACLQPRQLLLLSFCVCCISSSQGQFPLVALRIGGAARRAGCTPAADLGRLLLLLESRFCPVLRPNFQNMAIKQTFPTEKNTWHWSPSPPESHLEEFRWCCLIRGFTLHPGFLQIKLLKIKHLVRHIGYAIYYIGNKLN